MKIDVYTRGSFQVVSVSGLSLNDSSTSPVEQEVLQQLDKGTTDIARVFETEKAYPHSRVLSIIARCCRLAARQGGSITVVAPNADFVDLIRTIGLDRMVKIVNNEDMLDRS
jgi:hypothetical protein